ncbi:MAG: 16S rRNA (cytidine(1402)-2'-O)-methyltransferase [Deltaproteobacteria bacterium]|nr:16S rRNA (cytidine(1402)-2'-O)-methyltransferase [Deltaproteobacteria bacterium]MBW2077102.1 16S rRNA (cytidine(1402)-2'-O)-methyltransferase [Deltaproteobacteria bacterium]MBW2310906.1 16S rRNA (cytidine(1402)-2'-O)-methyltransferase [Deltaproteobacteria bacterium]
MDNKGAYRGTIYVVSTPIGNLEDITLRAIRVLREADLIAAESVVHTKKLCAHYHITTPLTSYNSHNQRSKGRVLLEKARSGLKIALVSDAGTPGLSDPGARLVRDAIDAGIPLVPVPGVSASLTALSISGLPTDRFVFVGFLSRKKGKRRRELEALKDEQRTMIFFEAPHRLAKMITDISEVLGNRDIVLAKELTKVFEQVVRGPAREVLSSLDDETIRGEYTVIVKGFEKPGNEISVIDNCRLENYT